MEPSKTGPSNLPGHLDDGQLLLVARFRVPRLEDGLQPRAKATSDLIVLVVDVGIGERTTRTTKLTACLVVVVVVIVVVVDAEAVVVVIIVVVVVVDVVEHEVGGAEGGGAGGFVI